MRTVRLSSWSTVGLVTLLCGCRLMAFPETAEIKPNNNEKQWPAFAGTSFWLPAVTDLQFSPDGQRLLVGRNERLQGQNDRSMPSWIGPHSARFEVRQLVEDNWQRECLLRNGYRVTAGGDVKVTMSTDGRVFAASHEKGIDLYRADDGSHWKHLDPPDERLWVGPVTPDCRQIVWIRQPSEADKESKLLLQDVQTGEMHHVISLGHSTNDALAISQDGRLLAIASTSRATSESRPHRRQLVIVDLKLRKIVERIPHMPDWGQILVRFSPNGSRIAIAVHQRSLSDPLGDQDAELNDGGFRVVVRDIRADGLYDNRTLPNRSVWDLTFSPDGSKLALGIEVDDSGKPHAEVQVWNIDKQSGDAKWQVQSPDGWPIPSWGVTAVAFRPDGKTLAVGTSVGLIEVYEVPQRTEQRSTR